MKNIFKTLIFLVLFTNITFAQDKANYFEWVSHRTLDTIRDVGHKYYFYQYCIEDVDSLIDNGTIAYSNASIANISKCKYEITIVDTIIEQITLTTTKSQDTYNLRSFTKQLCGELNHIYYKNKYHNYLSIRILNGKYCAILYTESKNKKNGKLIIMNSGL